MIVCLWCMVAVLYLFFYCFLRLEWFISCESLCNFVLNSIYFWFKSILVLMWENVRVMVRKCLKSKKIDILLFFGFSRDMECGCLLIELFYLWNLFVGMMRLLVFFYIVAWYEFIFFYALELYVSWYAM